MRRVACLTAWVMLAAGFGAGCQKTEWNWFQRPRPAPAPTSAPAAEKPISPEEAATLRSENAALRGQLDEMKIRSARLEREINDLQVLVSGHDKTIQALADAPAQRDTYKRQVDDLRGENERLRAEVRRLGGTPPAPASVPAGPAPVPTTAPSPG